MTAPDSESGASSHRCGIVTLAGRPNSGKSTLINRMIGQKVSITSSKPQTTRTPVRGVLTRPDAQVVFVDTPGIHKPRTAHGRSLNAVASEAVHTTDVACLVVDASAPYGRGDAFIARSLPPDSIVVVTKSDLVGSSAMLKQLAATAELDFEAYFPSVGAPVRASRPSSITWWAGFPRVRRCMSPAPCRTAQRRSGWLSWCARSS